MKQYWKIC